jgi:hypothetical protein
MNRSHYLPLWISIALGMLVWVTPKINLADVPKADGKHYLRMANAAPQLLKSVPAPFGYRILPSFLAGIAPLDAPQAFSLLSLLGLMCLPFLWFRWLKDENDAVKTGSCICLLMNPHLVGFVSYNPYQFCDVITFVLTLLTLIALSERRYWLVLPLMCVGVLSRETILLFIPFGVLLIWQQTKSTPKVLRYVGYCLPALLLMGYIRLTFTPQNTWSFVEAFQVSGGDALSPVIWLRLLLNTFAPLIFIPLFFRKTIQQYLMQNLQWVLMFMATLGSCFMAKDKERLLVIAFPIVYLGLAKLMHRYPPLTWILPLASLPIGLRYALETPDFTQRILVLSLNILAAVYVYRLKMLDDKTMSLT